MCSTGVPPLPRASAPPRTPSPTSGWLPRRPGERKDPAAALLTRSVLTSAMRLWDRHRSKGSLKVPPLGTVASSECMARTGLTNTTVSPGPQEAQSVPEVGLGQQVHRSHSWWLGARDPRCLVTGEPVTQGGGRGGHLWNDIAVQRPW